MVFTKRRSTHAGGPTSSQTPFERLGALCAHSGLSLEKVAPRIVARMRLLAETTETLRDCERAADLADQMFRHYKACRPARDQFTRLERRTIIIGSLFSDIGKTGPERAGLDGQRLVAEMFAVENVLDGQTSVNAFFAAFFRADASDRVRRFKALDLDPDMSMREFWNLHSTWTLEILRGDGVPPAAVAAAATHHLLENVIPHAMFATDARLGKYMADNATFDRPEKLVILLDKYDAARRRGRQTHRDAIVWLRRLIETNARFRDDQQFLSLITALDEVMSDPPHPSEITPRL